MESEKRPSWLALFVCYFVLFCWAALFSILEISIEGPIGWALAAPTWRSMNSIYAALMSGKELTGYHSVMFFLPLLFLHLPFVFGKLWGGLKWTLAKELELFAIYFVLCVTWDFLWFVLNPAFTLARFRPGEIWWHMQWLGRVPSDYIGGIAFSLAITAGIYWRWDRRVIRRMGMMLTVFAVLTLATVALAPSYHRWSVAEIAKNGSLSKDWNDKTLGQEDRTKLRDALVRLSAIREEIAAYGRKRAQKEQLGR